MEGGTTPARKVMVVADPTRESAAALQYALSHAILENDILILFHVDCPRKNPFGSLFKKPSVGGSAGVSSSIEVSSGGGGDVYFLDAMKQACESAQPKIKVVVEKMGLDGKDKASVILSQCKAYGIDIVIVGQKRSLSNAILGPKRSGSLKRQDTAEHLIENSKCTCVAVQKKGQNGGYLLNTKTHKNFWLLA